MVVEAEAAPTDVDAPPALEDPFLLFRRELREIVEDVEGLSTLIVQGLSAVHRARPPVEVGPLAPGLRVVDLPDEYEVQLDLPEAERGRFDVQISGQRLEFSAGPGQSALPVVDPPQGIDFPEAIDGDRAVVSADAAGVRVTVPKRRPRGRFDWRGRGVRVG